MRRNIGVAMATLVLSCAIVACTVGNAASDMPRGVDESQWRPLGQDLGLVVQGIEAGRMKGYLMCKVNGRWVPLSLQNTAVVVPAQ
ncbi:MAG: hypothetical protein HY049_13145 [Acidobacteria bacterium]|nr:hypothetical protein [Acidobacteriota bacterium]